MTKEQILSGESKNREFRVVRPKDSGKYMKTVVAFANSEGGTMVFGVEDGTCRIVGIDKDKVFTEMDTITGAIVNSCEPTIVPDISLQIIEGKTLIVVTIAPGRKGHTSSSPRGCRGERISGSGEPPGMRKDMCCRS